MTLADIKALPVAGNAYSDQHIFNAIDAFVHSDASLSDKASAIEWMDACVMGEANDDRQTMGDEAYVAEFIEGGC